MFMLKLLLLKSNQRYLKILIINAYINWNLGEIFLTNFETKVIIYYKKVFLTKRHFNEINSKYHNFYI